MDVACNHRVAWQASYNKASITCRGKHHVTWQASISGPTLHTGHSTTGFRVYN